jgi:hypothetical protein
MRFDSPLPAPPGSLAGRGELCRNRCGLPIEPNVNPQAHNADAAVYCRNKVPQSVEPAAKARPETPGRYRRQMRIAEMWAGNIGIANDIPGPDRLDARLI